MKQLAFRALRQRFSSLNETEGEGDEPAPEEEEGALDDPGIHVLNRPFLLLFFFIAREPRVEWNKNV